MTAIGTVLLSIWEKSGLFTKILIIWAFGPALGVYMFLGYKTEFKHEILADAKQEREAWAAPMIVKREAQISTLEKDIHEIKTDMRDIRNSLIGPRRNYNNP